MNAELIIKPNKRNINFRIIITLFLLFVFISILLVDYFSLLNNKEILSSIGIPSAYLGILICILFIRRLSYLRLKKNLLVINKDGLIDSTTRMSLGLIKWNEIKKVSLVNYFGLNYIGITLKNPKNTLSRISKVKRFLAKINQATVKHQGKGVPIIIGLKILDTPAEEIIRACNKYIE